MVPSLRVSNSNSHPRVDVNQPQCKAMNIRTANIKHLFIPLIAARPTARVHR